MEGGREEDVPVTAMVYGCILSGILKLEVGIDGM